MKIALFALLILILAVTPSGASLAAEIEDKPIKYAGNPLMTNDDWDTDINYNTVLTDLSWPIESRYRLWYAAYSWEHYLFSCYSYSSDGLNWIKPSLGIIEFNGSTDNNIIMPSGYYLTSVVYEDGEYYFLFGSRPTPEGPEQCSDIYRSSLPDRGLTLAKSLFCNVFNGDGMGLVKRYDGRWISYYQEWNASHVRKIGAYISDTTDITGSYTDMGTVIDAVSFLDQRYSIGVCKRDAIYYGFVPNYSKTTGMMDLSLYTSPDGLAWELIDKDWITVGSLGEWDDSMILDGESLIQVGEELWYYYCGSPETHLVYPPRGTNIGLVKIQGVELPEPPLPPEEPQTSENIKIIIEFVGDVVVIEILQGDTVLYRVALE